MPAVKHDIKGFSLLLPLKQRCPWGPNSIEGVETRFVNTGEISGLFPTCNCLLYSAKSCPPVSVASRKPASQVLGGYDISWGPLYRAKGSPIQHFHPAWQAKRDWCWSNYNFMFIFTHNTSSLNIIRSKLYI